MFIISVVLCDDTPYLRSCCRTTACFIFISPSGVRVGLFTPDRAFDMVTKAQIMKLKGPSTKLVDLVCQEVLGISRDITLKVVSHQQTGTITNILTTL